MLPLGESPTPRSIFLHMSSFSPVPGQSNLFLAVFQSLSGSSNSSWFRSTSTLSGFAPRAWAAWLPCWRMAGSMPGATRNMVGILSKCWTSALGERVRKWACQVRAPRNDGSGAVLERVGGMKLGERNTWWLRPHALVCSGVPARRGWVASSRPGSSWRSCAPHNLG